MSFIIVRWNVITKKGDGAMISDEEREKCKQARERISGPVKHLLPMTIPATGRKFDMTDQKTRLIYETPLTSESCWRTGEEDYVKWMLTQVGGGGPEVINTAEAHRMMNQR